MSEPDPFFQEGCKTIFTEVPISIPLKVLVKEQGPVVQSIISLTSLLMVKMLAVLVSTISKSQVVLLTFFSAKILGRMPYLMIKVLTIH